MTDLESIRASYDLDRWVLAGHSAGPNLALAYAMYRPDTVEGIVGIAGGNFMNDRDWHRAYDDGPAAGGDETGDLHFDSDPEVLTQLNREWKAFIKSPDVFRRLADLTMPVSLLGRAWTSARTGRCGNLRNCCRTGVTGRSLPQATIHG